MHNHGQDNKLENPPAVDGQIRINRLEYSHRVAGITVPILQQCKRSHAMHRIHVQA